MRGMTREMAEAREIIVDGVCVKSNLTERVPGGMKPIPISAAKHVADVYGYDQVVIYARRVGDDPAPHGEHMTTYGVDEVHCDVASRMGDVLKKFMGWSV